MKAQLVPRWYEQHVYQKSVCSSVRKYCLAMITKLYICASPRTPPISLWTGALYSLGSLLGAHAQYVCGLVSAHAVKWDTVVSSVQQIWRLLPLNFGARSSMSIRERGNSLGCLHWMSWDIPDTQLFLWLFLLFTMKISLWGQSWSNLVAHRVKSCSKGKARQGAGYSGSKPYMTCIIESCTQWRDWGFPLLGTHY